MHRKRIISLLVCFALVLVLSVPAMAAEKIVMRIGTVTVPPQPQAMAAEEFKRIVESKVGDRLDVQIYHASQLGTIPQHLQGLQNGSIHAIFMPNGFIAPTVPELSVLDLMFFLNADWVYKMFNKGYTQPLYDAMAAKGLLMLAAAPAPPREIFTSKKIETLDDFKGVRIRTYSSPINQQSLAALGLTSVNIDSAEMAVAIQQNTVDGIETDKTFWYSQKLFKAQYTLDFYQGSIFHPATFSKRWFDGLPPDIQQAVREAALEMAPLVAEYMDKTLMPSIAADPEAKLTRLELSQEVIDELRKRATAVHSEYTKQGPTFQKTYDYYKELLEKYPTGDAPALK